MADGGGRHRHKCRGVKNSLSLSDPACNSCITALVRSAHPDRVNTTQACKKIKHDVTQREKEDDRETTILERECVLLQRRFRCQIMEEEARRRRAHA